MGDGSEEEGNQGRRSTSRRGSLPASARSSSEWEQSSEEEDSEEDGSRAGRPWRRKVPKPVQKEPLNVDGFWSTNRLKRVMKREMLLRIGVEFSLA